MKSSHDQPFSSTSPALTPGICLIPVLTQMQAEPNTTKLLVRSIAPPFRSLIQDPRNIYKFNEKRARTYIYNFEMIQLLGRNSKDKGS